MNSKAESYVSGDTAVGMRILSYRTLVTVTEVSTRKKKKKKKHLLFNQHILLAATCLKKTILNQS